MREFVARRRGRIALEYLPAYAPELNPVEYLWGYWKHRELPNFCPRDFTRLSYQRAPRAQANAPAADPSDGFLGASEPIPTVTILRKSQ